MGASYRDLVAWQKGIQLVVAVYRCTRNFPRDELYGLTAQLRRAAVSVPSNIAEGQGRKSNQEFSRFLYNSVGSLMEVETQITIATALEYIPQNQADALLASTAELGRILNGLINSVEGKRTTAAGSH